MIGKGKILVVDDDEALRESVKRFLESEGYHSRSAASAESALEAVARERWDVILADIRMPEIDGVELLRRLKARNPEIPVIMVTAYASVETAVRTLKGGANDYLVKPFNLDELTNSVDRALRDSRTHRELERLRHRLKEVSPKTELVGQGGTMQRVLEQVETVSPTDVPVLITGERGTGKELVARAIHAGSPRSQMPLTVVRCGALAEEVLAVELYGSEVESASVGKQRKKGRFEMVDGGTVFLDEISEISPKMQNELLEVMETGQVVRVGGEQRVNVDFRWIAATNRGLHDRVREGKFREDFYYRLNVFSIELPPLRERREDIPLLANHFLKKHAAATNRPVPSFSKKAMDLLMQYSWPGNVRELENAVERALLLCHQDEVQPADFPFQMNVDGEPVEQSLDDVERHHIHRVVQLTNWNLSRSARILGIDRTTLYNKLKRYGLR